MARLIHLNGPAGVGKSTLAGLYADDHPGTLVLDLDLFAGLVGGWKQDFFAALEVARDHGREMAARHLRGGRDVILPQLVTVHDSAMDPAFELCAESVGATYVEVALGIDDEEHLSRLRGRWPSNEVQSHIQSSLTDPRSELVDNIREHLRAHLAGRPQALRLDTTGLAQEETYRRLLRVLHPDA